MYKKFAITTAALLASLSFSVMASTDHHKHQEQGSPASFESPDAAVEFRQAGFQTIREHFGVMGDMVRGNEPFDPVAFSDNAHALKASNDLPWSGFQDAGFHYTGDGDAKHDIWNNDIIFHTYIEEFKTATIALARQVEGEDTSLRAVRSAFMNVGRTCQQCHNEFRE